MRLGLADLRPGAVLAEDVAGPGGRRLAQAGTAVGEPLLQLLRAWGIEAVEVRDQLPAIDPEALLTAQRAAAARFRGQPADHPAIRALFQAAVARHLRERG